MKRVYSVLIAEDESEIRRALAAMVEEHPSFRVAGCAGDGKAAGGACPLHGGLSDSGDRRPVLSMPERRLCPAGGQYFRSQTAAGTELRILPKGLRRTARFAA